MVVSIINCQNFTDVKLEEDIQSWGSWEEQKLQLVFEQKGERILSLVKVRSKGKCRAHDLSEATELCHCSRGTASAEYIWNYSPTWWFRVDGTQIWTSGEELKPDSAERVINRIKLESRDFRKTSLLPTEFNQYSSFFRSKDIKHNYQHNMENVESSTEHRREAVQWNHHLLTMPKPFPVLC